MSAKRTFCETRPPSLPTACSRAVWVYSSDLLTRSRRSNAGGRPQVVWSNGVLASTAVGLAVLMVLIPPLYLILIDNGQGLDTTMGSFVMTVSSLLAMLVTRTSYSLQASLWSAVCWDAAKEQIV